MCNEDIQVQRYIRKGAPTKEWTSEMNGKQSRLIPSTQYNESTISLNKLDIIQCQQHEISTKTWFSRSRIPNF